MTRKLFTLAVLAIAATCVYGQGQGSGILYATDFNAWSLPQSTSPTAGMILWPSAICHVSSNGFSFMAVKIGRPLTIVDAVTSQTETVIPTNVTDNGGTCSVTAPMTYTHSSYLVRSGTAGLQEAIDYSARTQGGSVVVITPGWTAAGGQTSMITAASGQTPTSITDQRVATLCAYAWNGSAYAASGCSSSAASLATVSLQTFAGPLAVPSGITAPITGNVTGNASGTASGLSGSQTANYFYAAPNASPGTASFRAILAADIPTLNQNTTGTAGGLSANITESQVTNLSTDLGNRALTSTTVNSHALSSNVTVSASDLTTGTLPHAQLPTLLSGDIPNNAANTSGTAAGLSGSPAIAVASVAVNGGTAVTGNQGTGALVQHSTGSTTTNDCGKFDASGNMIDSGGPCGGVSSINSTPGAFTFTGPGVSCTTTTCTFSGTGTGVTTINSNTGAFTFSPSGWIAQATNAFTVKTQRGNDAVVDWGFDPSGTVNTTNVTAMGNYLAAISTIGAPGLKFPCGTYYFSSTISITSQTLIDFEGDGHAANTKLAGCVTFETDQNIPILWFKNTSAPLAGARIEHIQFADSSGSHNQVTAAVRITDQEHNYINDVSGWNLQGQHYNSTSDSIAVTQGSTTVTGTGTSFDTNCGGVNTSNAAHYPCFFVVKDIGTGTSWPYEVSSCASTTSCTLAIQYQGTTQGSAAYSIDSGGVLFWHDPGTSGGNATQYSNYFVVNTQQVWMTHYLASSASSSIVNSRINFWGGWNNGATGPQDSIFAYCGHFCDTMLFNGIAVNGHAWGVVIADGHQNTVTNSRFENTSAPSVPTYGSCSGAGYPCAKGVAVMADNASDTYGNQISENYFRQFGNGIDFSASQAGNAPTQSRLALNTFRTNTTNCVAVYSTATNSYGECDGAAAFNSLTIGAGGNTVYRCTVAGTLPVGALTTVSGNCGTAVATSLTLN